MQFSIIIPTYKRLKKIQRVIASIQNQTYKNWKLYVIADNNDIETYNWIKKNYKNNKIKSILNLEHKHVIGSINLFTKNYFNQIKDIFLFLCDDVELYSDCLSKIIDTINSNFNDLDFMIGISQEYPSYPNVNWRENGQCAIGKKFIERFPEYQIACPEYIFLYQDEEVLKYAKSINKFILSNAKLIHWHPCYYKQELDETHYISRGNIIKKDTEIYNKRKAKGLIWGKSFELIKEK